MPPHWFYFNFERVVDIRLWGCHIWRIHIFSVQTEKLSLKKPGVGHQSPSKHLRLACLLTVPFCNHSHSLFPVWRVPFPVKIRLLANEQTIILSLLRSLVLLSPNPLHLPLSNISTLGHHILKILENIEYLFLAILNWNLKTTILKFFTTFHFLEILIIVEY